MKRFCKSIAILLVIFACLSVFVSCGNPTEEQGSTAGGEKPEQTESAGVTSGNEAATEEEIFPDVEMKNYGEELYLSIMGDVNPEEYYWVKESQNNTMSDAVYHRQEEIRNYLGVEILATRTETEMRYIEPFKTAVKNKDGSVDILLSHVYYGIDGFISGNYLTDLKDIPEIDINADYWNYDFMEGIAAGDHFYLGFSDFNILYTHVITFNKEMLAKYEDQLDENIYSTVENYRWTIDKMMSVSSLAYVDATSDGKTSDDTFGFVTATGIGYAGFLQASNIQLVEMDDDGEYRMSIYNEKNKQKMSNLVDKLYAFVRSDSVLFVGNSPEKRVSNGTGLMAMTQSYALPDMLSSGVEFGVLPYPMYDEMQKDVGYRSLQWGGYICVPSYLRNAGMVGDTLEMISYFSDDVNIAFYEKLLGKQVAEAPQDRKMLDIVWNSVCSDIGQTYFSVIKDDNGYLYAIGRLTQPDTTTNLASYVATLQNKVNRNLKKFFAHVK